MDSRVILSSTPYPPPKHALLGFFLSLIHLDFRFVRAEKTERPVKARERPHAGLRVGK